MIGVKLTDGVTTLDLQTGSFAVMKFTPSVAARTAETVADQIEMEVADAPYGQSTIRQIQQMISAARIRAEEGHGRRVFVHFSLGTAGEGYWRSEIVDGRVELPEDVYQYDVMSGWLAFTILLTRLNYWESVTESGVSLQTAYSGSSGTPGSTITVYGHHRAADVHANLLRAIDTSIDGDLPTPCRFQIANNYSSDGPGDIYIGHMLEDDSNTLEHVIEGEVSAAYGASNKPTNVATSGGQYYRVAGSGATETILWSAAISQLALAGMAGNEFNIMARLPGATVGTDTIMRASLATDDGLSGLIERWSGREVLVPAAGGWITLGRVQLPPRYLVDQALPAPLRLRFSFFSLSGGSFALPIDYVMFMPVYGFRKYRRHSYGMDPGVVLHDRPNEGNTPLLYTDGWAEGKLDNFIAEGDPILLVPGRDNLLCIAFETFDTVLRTLSVRAYYRTRRLTV